MRAAPAEEVKMGEVIEGGAEARLKREGGESLLMSEVGGEVSRRLKFAFIEAGAIFLGKGSIRDGSVGGLSLFIPG